LFTLRFDMRAPETGAPRADLYAAALDMVAYVDGRGALAAVVCEHHTWDDGYLPSPLIMATAMAARTTTLPITVAIVILPLCHPVRLAEEMIVLDILSGGRVSYVAAIGYRPEEYELYGADFHRRGKLAEEKLGVLLRAKTGEPFPLDGRTVQVTPAPVTAGGPFVAWGGGSAAAARRAGRHGLAFIAQGGDPGLSAVYEDEARAHGHEPGFCMIPSRDTATTVFVADDVDRAWAELGPYLMHDVLAYASSNAGDTTTASLSFATTAEELRAENRTHRIVDVDEAVSLVRSGVPLQLHPLIGGLPPELAWTYLRRVVEDVMPQVGGS
jgi:alkanesulfonate monooxygenase SsuD/methylene tetrahydromethanopterin reductase-like flavin-dependent oxidoreductase (luciferase family)